MDEYKKDAIRSNYGGNTEETKKNKRKKCSEKLIDLSNKAKVLLPCGWNGTGSTHGHAMLLCVEQLQSLTEPKKFKITLLNTGSGLENHQQKIVGDKLKYCPARVFEELSFEEATNVLEESVVRPQTDLKVFGWKEDVDGGEERAKEEFNVASIYKIFDAISDYEKQTASQEFPFITAQRSGTCTARVFSPLKHMVFGKYFDAYKYELNRITNKRFLMQLKQDLGRNVPIDIEALTSAKYSLRNFSRFLLKLKEKVTIQPELQKM